MPYIKQNDRVQIDVMLEPLVKWLRAKSARNVAGLLNYAITKIIISLWSNCRAYHIGNSIIGALQCAAREFARRHLDPYEDEKIKENGDVHPFEQD
jgi:hypothetical protein